jgi:hypothetical protein
MGEGRRTDQAGDGRKQQNSRHVSEPLDDRFAQAVRQQIIEVQMELRDHPEMGAGVAVARDQCLDRDGIGVGSIVEADTPQKSGSALVRFAGRAV